MKKNKFRVHIAVLLVICGISVIFIVAANHLRPYLIENMKIAASNEFIYISNLAFDKIANTNELNYEEFAKITYKPDGTASSVTCDTVKLSKIKAEMNSIISSYVKDNGEVEFSVPLGTLFGSEYTIGIGPHITYKFNMSCVFLIDFYSEFSEAGYNQTLHKIHLKISSDVSAVLPWASASEVVENDYIVAETVLLGTVPNSLSDINIGEYLK